MYNVIHTTSGEEKSLEPREVNDMFTDADGRIIVCGTDHELYLLLEDVDLFE